MLMMKSEFEPSLGHHINVRMNDGKHFHGIVDEITDTTTIMTVKGNDKTLNLIDIKSFGFLEMKVNYAIEADRVIASYGSIKTPVNTGIPCLYEHGYYTHTLDSVNRVKGRITSLLGNKATTNVVDSIYGFIVRKTFVDIDFVVKKNMLCLENGLLNLDTMQLEPFHQSKVVFNKFNVTYDKNIDAEPIYAYIRGFIPEKYCDKIQEHVGNIFANHYLTKKLLYLYGPKNSGKSSLYKILMFFLGRENYCTLTLNEIGEKFTNAQIYGKLANICSDVPYKMPLSYYSRIKNLTGGDCITLQFKGKDAFNYEPTAKLFFNGNGVPIVDLKQADDAFCERFDFIECSHIFMEKKDIVAQYITSEMRSAFLNWAIEGFLRLKEQKWEYTNGDTSDSVRALFQLPMDYDLDDFTTWLVDSYEPDIDSWIVKKDLYYDCRDWHRAEEKTSRPYVSFYTMFCRKMLNNKIIPVSSVQPSQDGKQIEAFKGIRKRTKENTP